MLVTKFSKFQISHTETGTEGEVWVMQKDKNSNTTLNLHNLIYIKCVYLHIHIFQTCIIINFGDTN
jgi:hypothetical protein